MQIDTGMSFREIVTNESLPKKTIQQAIFDFLNGRDDAAVFGAMAVNAYVDERRMTEDVDIVAIGALEIADALKAYLSGQFHIAVRVRSVAGGQGFRLYQVAKPKNRHLADLRPVEQLPPHQRIDGVLVVSPAELVAGKVISYCRRKGKPKAGTDWRDVAHLLLTFPKLKSETGEVLDRLLAKEAGEEALQFWKELVAQDIQAEEEDEEFL